MADDDKLSFLDRDDKGRFTSKEPKEETPTAPVDPAPVTASPEPPKAPEPTPVPPAEPAAPAQPSIPPGYVPLAAQLDEREKRQALQRELDDYKRKLEEATKKPVELDAISDPDGFKNHFDQQIARTKWDTLTTLSRTWAVKAHGEETVKAAEEAIKAEVERNPGFFQTIERQPDPYDFGVSWHKRQQAIAKLGDKDPDTWFEEQAKARGYVLATPQPANGVAPAAPAPATPTPLPRPSLASAPAAGGTTPKVATGPGAAFGGVFSK